MKITLNSTTGGVLIEFEAETQAKAAEQLASHQEVFAPEPCGQCGEVKTRWRARKAEAKGKPVIYYERFCPACTATLSYGVTMEGGKLYPKRKLEDGSWDSEHHGWKKWKRQSDDNDDFV